MVKPNICQYLSDIVEISVRHFFHFSKFFQFIEKNMKVVARLQKLQPTKAERLSKTKVKR